MRRSPPITMQRASAAILACLVLAGWSAAASENEGPAAPDPSLHDPAVEAAQAPGTPAPRGVASPAPAPVPGTGGLVGPRPPVPATAPGPPLAALAEPIRGPSAVAFPPATQPSLIGLEQFRLVGIPQMLGDQAPIFGPAQTATTPSGTNAVRLPWVRGYKMADNQSPLPLDRVFATFYFYDDLNIGPGRTAGGSIRDVKVYREFFGLEKTFLDGQASLGLRLPLDSISARGTAPGVSGSSTSLGNLTIFGKYALVLDPETGHVFSLGLAITAPTGPAAFAGADFTRARNPTYFQPFVGFLRPFGRLYVQGFSGINVPTDSRVVTMFYNDVGAGYYLFRADLDEALLRAIVPAMEVHVNTPLNHRGGFSAVRDPGATFDSVNLTFGLNAVLRRSVLSVGFVEPVTGPRPFQGELIALLNVYFGGSRAGRRPPTAAPPPLFGN